MRHKFIALAPLLIFGLLLATASFALADQAAVQPKVVAIDRDNSMIGFDYRDGTSLALLDNGTLWAWGHNVNGQIGDGTTDYRSIPVMVPIDHIVDASIANGHALACKGDGTVWEWGNGDLWNNNTATVPRQVAGLSGIKKVVAGPTHYFAIKNDGTVWAWGSNKFGELGIGKSDASYIYTPVQVPISGVGQISLGTRYTMALKSDGTVWAAGEGASGLGYGGFDDQWSFVQVPISNITAISCGPGGVTLSLKNDGTVWGWGENGFYQLGNYTSENEQATPVRVGGLTDVVAVSAGNSYAMALKKDGTAWAWGCNNRGNLGNGNDGYFKTPDPVKVVGLDHVTAISAGEGPGIVLKDDGTVWTWGTTNHSVPYEINPKPRQVYVGSPAPEVLPEPMVTIMPPQTQPIDNTTYAEFANATVVAQNWASSINDTIRRLAFDGAGGLYAFGDHTIYRLKADGEKDWSLDIPSQWQINGKYWRPTYNYETTSTLLEVTSQPVFDTHDGYLYLYLTPSKPYPCFDNDYGYGMNINTDELSWALVTISPEGKIARTLPLETNREYLDSTTIQAIGDRVYLFHNYNETVLNKDGHVIFSIPDISDPAAVDESGNLYVTRTIIKQKEAAGSGYRDYRLPSSTIVAYSSNGSLLWSKDLGENLFRQFVAEEIRPKFSTLPLYQDGTLYLPMKNGIIAMDTNGSQKWSKRFDDGYYGLFNLMPLDGAENVYLGYFGNSGQSPYPQKLYVMDNDGRIISGPVDYTDSYCGNNHIAANDGIIYKTEIANLDYRMPVDNLPYAVVTAYDIRNNTNLWTYKIALSTESDGTIDLTNMGYLEDFMDTGILDPAKNADYFLGRNLTVKPPADFNNEAAFIDVTPGSNAVYVSFRALKYEYPVILGESKAVYASGIYAFGLDGKPLAKTESGSLISAMAVNNSTVFFGTIDGRVTTAAAGAVAGIVLLGAIAIAAKLLLFGTVTRARSKVDKNDNRNLVIAYIKEHPGSTLYEISRGIEMNMGTVRYHVFILGLNHKITTFNDGKFVRYFPNSNFYSKEEQLVISLMRREPIRKIIDALIKSPGMTNAELARETGQPNSAISKLTKELCMKGIGVKEEVPGDEIKYKINDACANLIKNLDSKIKNVPKN